MCVNTTHEGWERPATQADCAVLARHFSGINFNELLGVMSEDGARPLTTDLVLVGAMMHTQPDALGMRYVPFSAIESARTQNIIKLPVMDQVVAWFENTALGTDMWNKASDWCEEKMGARVHFAMNCGCGLVAVSAYENGLWQSWKRNFNRTRSHLFGRTTVVRRDADSLNGLDMTPAQLGMWQRIRACLRELAAISCSSERLSA